ncbi:c-type cytochrome [Aureispira anguillae]|uniref:Cytochrome c n=1 Tax=Aureispira anguillae TaxID=2864201 RepID=A0A915YBR7_9BACT|nr:cytochrome c [Aureispira anguillae]BDS10163.1 cytochrome c [Aureispira anguillae]
MNQQEMFSHLNRLTNLGVLIGVAFVLLTGMVLQEGLSNGFDKQENYGLCGTKSEPVITCGNCMQTSGKMSYEIREGKTLFLENCASCHNNDMVSDMTGPALYGVTERWKKRTDLYRWIQNYQELVDEGHPRAVAMKDWAASEMVIFPNLDTTQISQILAYIEYK